MDEKARAYFSGMAGIVNTGDHHVVTSSFERRYSLTYFPRPYSEVVSINGIIVPTSCYWVEERTIIFNSDVELRTGDEVDIRYVYLGE